MGQAPRERSPGSAVELPVSGSQGSLTVPIHSGTTPIHTGRDHLQRNTPQRATSGALSRVDSASSWVPILSQQDGALGDPRRRGRPVENSNAIALQKRPPSSELSNRVERIPTTPSRTTTVAASTIAGPLTPSRSGNPPLMFHSRSQQMLSAQQRSAPSNAPLTSPKNCSGLPDAETERPNIEVEVAFNRRIEEAKLIARDKSTVLEGEIEQLQQIFLSYAEKHQHLRQQYSQYQDLQTKSRVPASSSSSERQIKSSQQLNEEVAARKLQRAALLWLGRRRRYYKREEGSTRDRWRRVIQDVETSVNRALHKAEGIQGDISRAPRQTRLQLLANVLKQGVLKVNQAMMQQMLMDLKGPSSSRGEPSDVGTGLDDDILSTRSRTSSNIGS